MVTKVFSMPETLGSDLINTVATAKNNIGSLNYRIVPLAAIEFDPTNPRRLAVTRYDVLDGIKKDDPKYLEKQAEMESLQQMAETIKKYGVRNAVEIYKNGDKYRLIHGERRCLSSILAGKSEIPAKILEEKPNNFDIKLLQLIENVQREGLTLYETLNNIKAVISEYKENIDPNVEINASFIEQIINKSRAQSFNILVLLNASQDIQYHIKNGEIKNIEKAALIAKEKNKEARQELLAAALKGTSLVELAKMKRAFKSTKNEKRKADRFDTATKNKKIKLGDTGNRRVILKLIQLVCDDIAYKDHVDSFNNLDLDSDESYVQAFRKMIKVMENIEIA